MKRALAESFADEIERDELRDCKDRFIRYSVLVDTTSGPERQEWLRHLEITRAELQSWTALLSLIRSPADEFASEEDLMKIG
jgi:hypothetical protein